MSKSGNYFERLANTITCFTGSTLSFVLALGFVVVWAATGPLFHFSEQWQLVINTGTTIITFLMVFLIQKSQNKDSLAVQIKLNELLAAHERASNRIVNVEDLSEAEMKIVQKYYHSLAEMAKRENTINQSHSIDEAKENHLDKLEEQVK